MGIRFHNLFWFALWSYLGLMTWMMNLFSWLKSFLCFFNWFFFNFIFQHWVDWELSFIICFYLLSIFFLIPWPRYNTVTQVDSTYFLVKFCFQFYYSTLDWLRIEFNNFFYFLSIRLLGSHNLDNKFDRLSRVDPSLFNILSF